MLQAVTWPSLLKLMRTHEPQLIWDEKVAEHAFVYQVRSRLQTQVTIAYIMHEVLRKDTHVLSHRTS